MNYFFTITYFLSLLGLNTLSNEVDFRHKKVSKEISRTFETSEFILLEIESIRHMASNGEELGKYFYINKKENNLGYLYLGRVFTCPSGGCDDDINSSQTTEYFDYFIIYNTSKKLVNIVITNYQATHGQEVCAKGWLRQFIGFQGDKQLKVSKNIDSISGATRSTHAITADITKRTMEIRNL